MKKGTVIAIAVAGVLALGGGSVYAAEQIAKSSAIGSDSAKNFAFVDAGVLPEDAQVRDMDFEFEHGKFVYEIEFVANGIKYEYTIDSKDGRILEKDSEKLPGVIMADAGKETENKKEAPVQDTGAETPENNNEAEPASGREDGAPGETGKGKADTGTSKKTAPAKTGVSESSGTQRIGLSKAKSIVLKDAGLTGKKVTYSEAQLEKDDGRFIYDLEFRYGSKKYEYEVDAYTGKILEKDVETVKTSGPAGNTGSTGSSGTSNTSGSKKVISVAEAKAIALKKVGLTEKQVTFTKAKLDREDGEYEIEFYVKGKNEYEIEINAYTGKVLEVDIEAWDD